MTNDSSHSRRWLWLSIALLVLPALVLWLLHAWLGWEGERLWQQAQARLKAEGETLDFMALVPKPVPDEDNFFAVEPLKDIALVVDGDETKGEPGARRARIEELKFADEAKRPFPKRFTDPSYDEGTGVDHGQKWNAKIWADYYRESKRLPMPEVDGDPAEDLMAALAKGHGLYAKLHTALDRTYSITTPYWSEREMPVYLIALRHVNLNSCQTLTRLLALRAEAGLAANLHPQAARDIRVMLRIAEGVGQDATLINALVTMNVSTAALEPCWSLLEHAKCDGDTLSALEGDLARVDICEMMMTSLRGEMLVWTSAAEMLGDQAGGMNFLSFGGGRPSGVKEALGYYAELGMWSLNPQGIAKGNKGQGVQTMLFRLLRPLRNNGLKGFVDASNRLIDDLQSGRTDKGVMALLSREMLPVYNGVGERAILCQARLDQARLACALERYFLQHQTYPDTLNELVPAFIDKVLLDPCDDKPMRYARTPAGRYKLWSLGFDGEDDGGKVIASPMDDPSKPRLDLRDYPGDWVWSYERLVPLAEE